MNEPSWFACAVSQKPSLNTDFFSGYLKEQDYSMKAKTLEELEEYIREVMSSIAQVILIKSRDTVFKQLKKQ